MMESIWVARSVAMVAYHMGVETIARLGVAYRKVGLC